MDKLKYLKLKERYGNEEVFVVVSDKVSNIGDLFQREAHTLNIWSRYNSIGKYIKRYDAEENPAFKQIIPYIIIFNENMDKVFATKRIAGEDRLLGQLSIGIGGHVNLEDGYIDPLFKCAYREMSEEVSYVPTRGLKYQGTVRDLTSKLNDHLGIVFFMQAMEDSVSVNEKESLEGKWMNMQELKDNYGKLESWAKYITDYIYENNII